MKRVLFILFILFVSYGTICAKTEKFGTWIELTFTKKFLKDFEFSIIPEFRLQDDFTMDEYIFEGKLGYEPFKYLDLAASYRLNTNVKTKGNVITHSLVFDATGKIKIDRFNASLRTRFSNESDSGDNASGNYLLRPRVKLQYNIRKSKFEPYISYELFHNLKKNSIEKGRFDAGINRDLGKHHKVGLYYRLQDYFPEKNAIIKSDKNSINILGINYGFKF